MLKLLTMCAVVFGVYTHFDGIKAILSVSAKAEANAAINGMAQAAGAQRVSWESDEVDDAGAQDEAKELVAARRRMIEERTKVVLDQM